MGFRSSRSLSDAIDCCCCWKLLDRRLFHELSSATTTPKKVWHELNLSSIPCRPCFSLHSLLSSQTNLINNWHRLNIAYQQRQIFVNRRRLLWSGANLFKMQIAIIKFASCSTRLVFKSRSQLASAWHALSLWFIYLMIFREYRCICSQRTNEKLLVFVSSFSPSAADKNRFQRLASPRLKQQQLLVAAWERGK